MTAPDDRPQPWKVRQHRKTWLGISWNVYEPDGSWSNSFYSWDLAIDWATNIGTRVEHWLEKQR